jgi:hypothetical protein
VAGGRYDSVEIATIRVDAPQGARELRYLRRRALPDPRDTRAHAFHRVALGDRLDLLATRYLGDPLAAWQLADANLALDPFELTDRDAEGDLLTIPLPGGSP